jgi:hypothetical protein
MSRRVSRGAMLLAFTVLITGCATSQEWAEWNEHSSHFASGDHAFFSVRNREGATTRVTRSDMATARSESWWGKAITVSSDEIQQN